MYRFFGHAKVFSKIDCNLVYWQIEFDPGDSTKTAFTSYHGLFQYERMSFGLKNALSTFQRVVDIVLASVQWQYALVYFEDINVFSETVEDHLQHLDSVLHVSCEAGLSLKLKKCFSLWSSVVYLGHIVSPGKASVATKTVDTVQGMKPPTNSTELRSFLGSSVPYTDVLSQTSTA